MTPEEIQVLYAYDGWANSRILEACSALSAEQFTRNIVSSFPSVRDTLAHMAGAQWIWTERFNGRPTASLPKADGYPDITSLRAWWTRVQADLFAFVGKLSPVDLERSFEYRDTKGNAHRSVYREVLQHLVNHGTYHRGQITTLLRQVGAEPVSTDLIAFYRERAAHSLK
jgi:uncharacterized damage-inducible protein DinB